MFNNSVNAAMDYFWSAQSLQRLAMMAVDASEVSMLVMISAGGGGPVAADREACLDTGHGGVIF